MLLNPRQIEAFRALMLTGSTVRAAESMRISQPAVSRLLQDLQHRLGLTLFTRRGQRLAPTAEAIALFSEVERSYVGLDRIAQAAAEIRARRAGVLRIAVLPALANGFLPRFVGHFMRERPKLDLAVYGLLSHLVLDWVANGQCDIGFVAGTMRHPAVSSVALPQARMVAIVPERHRLARRRRVVAEDFADEDFVSLTPGASSRAEIDQVFASRGIVRRLRIETPLSEIACAIVASGAAVAIVDPFTATEYEGTGLVSRPFEPAVTFAVSAVYATHRGLSSVAQEFLEEFSALLRMTG
jgi:DNA-binding transcriptional LysR family regulator